MCASLLAMAVYQSTLNVECTGLIASRLAHRGMVVIRTAQFA